MRRWLVALVALSLAVAAIGCQKTILEPGEPEHGGVFLHGTPPPSTNP
jgi:hypothetical protein